MTNYEIQRRLRKIREAHGDPERQHAGEDALLVDVLRAVADDACPLHNTEIGEDWYEAELQHIQDLCRAALESLDIEFPRRCS